MRKWQAGAMFLVAVWLGGCVSQPPLSEEDRAQTHLRRIEVAIEHAIARLQDQRMSDEALDHIAYDIDTYRDTYGHDIDAHVKDKFRTLIEMLEQRRRDDKERIVTMQRYYRATESLTP